LSGKVIAARLAATQLLHGVLFDKKLLSNLLALETGPLERLSGPDRARAQSLVTGVLRHLGRIDAVLAAFMERPPPPKVMQTLRLVTWELLGEGTAAHGAVNAAVEIVRGSRKAGHLAGLVNAVARKVASEGPAIWQNQAPQSLPSWLARPIAKNFGPQSLAPIEAAHQAGAAIDISLKNPSRAPEFERALNAARLPNGSLRLSGRPQVSHLPGYAEGDWWIQDAAASMPAGLLGPVKGLRVLDLCAAPGGKTMQLAACGAEVTALDVSAARLGRLRENLDRTGLQAQVIVADALNWRVGRLFDAVLLDAPCSGTGTIRRHPDLPVVKAGMDMADLFELQAGLIDAAFGFLKPGGRLVYCTCSLLPREGEVQLSAALGRLPGASVAAPVPAVPPGVEEKWRTSEGGWRLRPDYWPDLGGMDGFYMALLEKAAPAQ